MKLNIQNSKLEICAGTSKQFPFSKKMQIALSGRSNVGKSSLINCLLSRKNLARVSKTPGKTITVNFYSVDDKIYLVDLPGYGFAKRTREDKERWSYLTDSFFTERREEDRSFKGVAQLIDLKVGITPDDEMMLDYLCKCDIPFFIIATKADKLGKTEMKDKLDLIKKHPLVSDDIKVIPFSSMNDLGKDEVWSEILSLCN